MSGSPEYEYKWVRFKGYKLAEEYGVAKSTINRYISGVRRG